MIENIINKQRAYFNSGVTLDYNVRINALKQLKSELIKNKDFIIEAFIKDFNKQEFDVIATEFAMVLMEIDYMLKHLKKLMKPVRKKTHIFNFPSKGYIYNEPYGVCLIISPWNYPLQLSLVPLVGAIASGNTVILKPSNYSENVSNAIYNLLKVFDKQYIYVCLGDRTVNANLLDQRFDFIFFTGGFKVGKIVMEKASKYLTPVCLELGGKSPCIVTKSCDIPLSAKRIVWGKYLNAGQTCVAPDYLLVDKSIKKELIDCLIDEVKKQNYINEELRSDFCYIINEKHVERLKGLIDHKNVIFGGNFNGRLLEPTIMDNVAYNDLIMQEEIFGPILPIIEFDNIDDVINDLKQKEKSLALYLFSNDKKEVKKVLKNISFGGGCINETIMHLTNDNLPFGGVGQSGMGNYHGKASFQIFSHQKSILCKHKMEINIKYPPYTNKKLKLLKKFSKIEDE